MLDDYSIEIQVRVKFKGKRKHKDWAVFWWPAVPRVGELINLKRGGMVEVEQVEWESSREKTLVFTHTLAVLFCKSEDLEPGNGE